MEAKLQAGMILALAMGGEDAGTAVDIVTGMGTRAFQADESLPTQGSPINPQYIHDDEARANHEKSWAATGIEFGEATSKDMFVPVKLADGWKKVRTDHPLWTHLIDDKGRIRAEIFYQSAFWDSEAFIRLVRRFTIRKVYFETEDDNRPIQFEIHDSGVVMYQTKITNPGRRPDRSGTEESKAFYERQEAMQKDSQKECKDFLDAQWPDWEQDWAHWD